MDFSKLGTFYDLIILNLSRVSFKSLKGCHLKVVHGQITCCSYRWCTSPSMVQLVPLCFQVLTEGLLEWWSHFGNRSGIAAPHTSTQNGKGKRQKRQGGRTLIHLPFKHPSCVMEPKTEAFNSELVPYKSLKTQFTKAFLSLTLPEVLTDPPVNQHPCYSCWRPHPTHGSYLGASTSSTEYCEQEQAAERTEAQSLQPSFYTT